MVSASGEIQGTHQSDLAVVPAGASFAATAMEHCCYLLRLQLQLAQFGGLTGQVVVVVEAAEWHWAAAESPLARQRAEDVEAHR